MVCTYTNELENTGWSYGPDHPERQRLGFEDDEDDPSQKTLLCLSRDQNAKITHRVALLFLLYVVLIGDHVKPSECLNTLNSAMGLKSASRSPSNGILEARLTLMDSGRVAWQGLVIALSFSDVRENAQVALENLLVLIDDDDNTPLDPKSDALVDKVEQVKKQGKTLMQSNPGESIRKDIPAVDILVDTVDNVVPGKQPQDSASDLSI